MFKEIFVIFIIDHSFIYLNYLKGDLCCLNSKRWFFLHCIINFIIVYYSFNDMITCINNITECYNIKFNNNSIKTFNYAVNLHIYHCIFFKLTKDDYIHHFIMVLICGTISFFCNSLLIIYSLFFLSGLPGGIDYFFLYLVKINYLNKISEKKINIFLSGFIRLPGCVSTMLIGYYGVKNYYNSKNYITMLLLLINSLLVYCNGIYYFMRSYKSLLLLN